MDKSVELSLKICRMCEHYLSEDEKGVVLCKSSDRCKFQRKMTGPLRKKKCKICGKEFFTDARNGKYCSLECKDTGYALRRKKWQEANPEYYKNIYQKNKEAMRAYYKEYYPQHKEEYRERYLKRKTKIQGMGE